MTGARPTPGAITAAGEASRAALVRLLSRGRVMIERLGTDPYGRTLATVSVGGVDAGDYLIAQGLAQTLALRVHCEWAAARTSGALTGAGPVPRPRRRWWMGQGRCTAF
jgi:hypothetical protein